jgi:hypothetical protein
MYSKKDAAHFIENELDLDFFGAFFFDVTHWPSDPELKDEYMHSKQFDDSMLTFTAGYQL